MKIKNPWFNRSAFLFLVFFVLNINLFAGANWENLAKTPPMGFNTWNAFGTKINEKLLREIVNAFIAKGFKEKGYEYIVIDDGWQIARDEKGNIIADPEKFPSGIKVLADYIHSKGLKFGIYTDAGMKTCEGRPGSRGYEFQDMKQYAEWGVDYVKIDWCYADGQNTKASYSLFRDAIKASGRPMVLSICEWGLTKPWLWARGIGHLWRTTLDIADCWDCGEPGWYGGVKRENFIGFTKILDQQVGLESYAGPGHWNNPDMLEVGNGGLTLDESKAHFSLWCILAAPLMIGADIRNISPEFMRILLNSELIAVDQDSMGKQGIKVRDDGDHEVWSKQLNDGSRAVVLFNRGKISAKIKVLWTEIGYPKYLKAKVRDLWQKKDMGYYKGKYSALVPPHGVVVIKIKP